MSTLCAVRIFSAKRIDDEPGFLVIEDKAFDDIQDKKTTRHFTEQVDRLKIGEIDSIIISRTR